MCLYERPYARDIIKYCNRISKDHYSLVEIGCGLGEITRNINLKQRIGCDADERVLKAARFLSYVTFKNNILFRKFKFPEDKLINKFDIIIMVNWIHEIDSNILKNKLSEYFYSNLADGGTIIIDTVQNKNYLYNHKIAYLTSDLDAIIKEIGLYECDRRLYSILKMPRKSLSKNISV
jgi:SAM-dependent methyltransferase